MTKDGSGFKMEMDRRFIEKRLLRKQTTEKDLAAYLAALPDVSKNAEEIVIDWENRSQDAEGQKDAD
jgi:hypothetical protein